MGRYLPRGQVTHKTAGKVLSNTGGGALRDRMSNKPICNCWISAFCLRCLTVW
ncbi:hypothetical protein ACV8TK_20695 [Citrobacter portucalensis]